MSNNFRIEKKDSNISYKYSLRFQLASYKIRTIPMSVYLATFRTKPSTLLLYANNKLLTVHCSRTPNNRVPSPISIHSPSHLNSPECQSVMWRHHWRLCCRRRAVHPRPEDGQEQRGRAQRRADPQQESHHLTHHRELRRISQ